MTNPWMQLPKSAPFALPEEYETLVAFNGIADDNHKLQLDVLPEPFIGNPDAPVVLLSLNPGFDKSDHHHHAREDFSGAIWRNLRHDVSDYPFYFLDPRFKDTGGAAWWLKKLRVLIEDTSLETVAQGLFCVEIFGYHSVNYRAIPKKIRKDPLPHQQYGFHLVRQAIERGAAIVVMRQQKNWLGHVPELESYPIHNLRSPLNPAVSPGNLDSYDRIRDLIGGSKAH